MFGDQWLMLRSTYSLHCSSFFWLTRISVLWDPNHKTGQPKKGTTMETIGRACNWLSEQTYVPACDTQNTVAECCDRSTCNVGSPVFRQAHVAFLHDMHCLYCD